MHYEKMNEINLLLQLAGNTTHATSSLFGMDPGITLYDSLYKFMTSNNLHFFGDYLVIIIKFRSNFDR